MRKSLKDISWLVDEPTYRADNSLSYSKLSQFFRSGPKALISNEKVDSPALRAGSLVDCILTCPEEFDDRFYVADIDRFSDTVRLIVEMLSQGCPEAETIDDCIDQYMLDTLNTVGYQSNWKDDTRIKKIKESGADYFTVLKYSTGKIVVSPKEFQEAQQCVQTLKTHPFTYHIFECDEDEEIFYQLKFKNNIAGVDMRCMFDIIKINYKHKWIRPLDLKTSGKNEEEFENSFISWNYWIQGQSYPTIMSITTDADEYFREFEILPFQFVVINKHNLTPLVWEMDHKTVDDFINDKYGIGWYTLLEDANWHLKEGKLNYSRRSYENKGCNPIQLKL